MTLNDYELLKDKYEDAKEESSRLEGALTQLMLQLKNDYSCESVSEARVKLEEMETLEKELTEEIDKLELELAGILNE